MIYLGNLTLKTETQYKVGLTAYKVDSTGKSQYGGQYDLSKGVLVTDLPQPNIPDGKVVGTTLVDTATKTVSYEYVDKPIDKNEQLQQQVTTLGQQVATLAAQNVALSELIAMDVSIGNTHYEKYADGRVHEWGTYNKDIAYTVKYGETMWLHSDTNDTSVVLPVQIDISKSYVPNVSFNTTGLVWCANTIVQNTSSGGNTVSTLYYRTVSGSQQADLPVEIHWDIWGFWK